MKRLDSAISGIISILEKREKVQDQLVVLSREIVRECANAIKSIHAREMPPAEARITNAGKLVKNARKIEGEMEHIMMQAYQEFAEARILLSILKGSELPTPESLDIPLEAYLTGICDAIGELRREMLEELKRGNKKEARHYFESMNEMYEATLPIRFSNSLIPNFRRKQDVARIQVEQARSELLR